MFLLLTFSCLLLSCLLFIKDNTKHMHSLNSITIQVAMQPLLHPVQTPVFHLGREDTLVVSMEIVHNRSNDVPMVHGKSLPSNHNMCSG